MSDNSTLSLVRLTEIFETYLQSQTYSQRPPELYRPIDYILSLGGKRIRPLAVLLGHQLYSNTTDDALPIAMAVELFHNFSLMHDDIMDESELRRGQASTHIRYGINNALLSGDMALVLGYEYIAKCPSTLLAPLLNCYSETARLVCEGQQLDMNFETIPNPSLAEYMEMIRCKTAVLLGASLALGAIRGGATEAESLLLYNYGSCVGISFQLRDDYLDSFGEPMRTGKKAAGDIMQCKKTYLYIHTLNTLNGHAKNSFMELYNHPKKSGKDIEQILSIMRSVHTDASILEAIAHYDQQAKTILPITIQNLPAFEPIRQLQDMLLHRMY